MNIRPLAVFSIAIGLLLCSTWSASGHHSTVATYLVDERATIRGEVIKFEWRNPHSYIILSVITESGEPETWAVEWDSPGHLARAGLSPDTLKPGQELVITGLPARAGRNQLELMRLVRPADGFELNLPDGRKIEIINTGNPG